MDERKGPRATSSQQRLSVADVLAQVRPDTHIKICTGDALTQDLRLGLLAEGFPEDRLHIEAFALALSAEDLGITISLGDHSFRPARSLLEALEQGKVAPDSEWRTGDCALCSVEIIEGCARDILTGAPATGRVLACSVIPESDLKVRHIG